MSGQPRAASLIATSFLERLQTEHIQIVVELGPGFCSIPAVILVEFGEVCVKAIVFRMTVGMSSA